MGCRQLENGSSSDESYRSDTETDADAGHETDLTDADTDADGDEGVTNRAWLLADQDHPPEYYLKQLEEFDDSEFTKEDYAAGSTLLLDRIEEQWCQYCTYIGIDPEKTYRIVSIKLLYSFFDWLLNQRRGKGGRKRRGTKLASSLGTYWKVYRLVYERATGGKIDPQMTRQMHKVLRKLAKKHGLSKKNREKPCMYVEDLAEVVQTNLVTTKKRYSHGRHRMQTGLFLQLGGITGNRPKALLELRYRHITVTLLRDPENGPHRLLLEFTFEFTKEYLGIKDANTFPIPEIIYDPSLVLSPHVFLLGLIFADRAFAASKLTSPDQLSRLDIPPGLNELRLPLRSSMDNIPVFRRSVKALSGWKISRDLPLPYSTLLPWMKKLGVITGFRQIARPYTLRYAAGKAFDESDSISDPLRNLIMQHADTRTFLKHYLSRHITADTQAIVRGLKPQHALMRAACRMSRSIDPRRPQDLTMEQSLSVNEHPRIRSLIQQRDRLKRRLKGKATQNPVYKELGREITNERQRQRHALLKDVQERWENEQPVRDIERQLSGLKFTEDVRTTLESSTDKTPEQKRLIEAVMTLPGTSLEDEVRRRNAAIDAVTDYCKVEEGGTYLTNHPRRSVRGVAPMAVKTEGDTQPVAASTALDEALDVAISSVYKEKRPKICFLCLGNQGLPVIKRVYSFTTPGDLSKHFRRKHLSNLKEDEQIECKLCGVSLAHREHLQNHAFRTHGTVS
ncbi:hypothetical protein H2201_008651 [Coniosporium apollinis]|uniref:C2H2-type domain-containing protein n=1 Tax=Coniosporium apollinis TaxID=61459 RepID=A0ABQ9NID0_9PEZI|nr:hypothetical protein H2201_008651 [Coniosporium apollinis]